MRIVIVLPTYNERGNILPLLQALGACFGSIRHDMHILVVDDNSPDGTAELVRQAQRTAPYVHLITGEKQGLGAAYIRGMHYALSTLRADAVMEMDADFSHKPADVPRMVDALDQGADFVIGSRYVPGGSIPREWSFLRKMNSKWGNVFARHVAGLAPVRDCTAGFRAIRGTILSQIDLDAIGVKGYAFQIALLHQALVRGAVVKEVPVEFIDRKHGTTKLGMSDIIEFMINAWWIRFDRSRTFLRFAAVGTTGVAVNLAVFSLLVNAGLNKYLASPAAIELSIISNFLLNNYWTFAHRENAGAFHIRGLKFNVVSLLALGVSFSAFVLLSMLDPDGNATLHQAIGIVPAMFINYFLNSYWTFKDRP